LYCKKMNYNNLDDVIIFDDVIPETYQDWLLLYVKRDDITWSRKDFAISDLPEHKNDPRNGFANFIKLYQIDGVLDLKNFEEHGIKKESSNLKEFFMPLVFYFVEKLKINFLIRMRINAVPVMGTNLIQLPHVDNHYPTSWNIIYYLNDTDGDTIIYNEKAHNEEEVIHMTYKDDWTIKKRISPKKGRAVAFKGNLFHSSSLPTTQPRFVVNINVCENFNHIHLDKNRINYV